MAATDDEVAARQRAERPDGIAEVDVTPRRDLSEYERGYLEGMTAFAWWKDGVMYVGTSGRTLRQATKAFLVRVGAL